MGTTSSSPRDVVPPPRPGRHAPLWLRLIRESVFCIVRQLSAPWLFVRVENRPSMEGMGPVIIAPNHVSFLDPPALQAALRHHVTFMMAEAYYRLPVIRWFFRLWGAIPVSEGRPATSALREALRTLEAGAPLVIFPEGRISRDGYLQKGMRGIGLMLTKTGAPVIPVTATIHILSMAISIQRPRITRITTTTTSRP